MHPEASLRAALTRIASLFVLSVFGPVPSWAQDAPVGSEIFGSYCSSCHGAQADGAQGPSLLVGAAYAHGSDDQSVTRTIREGFAEGGMPAFGAVLSDAQIGGIVAFLHQLREAPPPPSTKPNVELAYQPVGCLLYTSRCV